jgi:hypothetical protein
MIVIVAIPMAVILVGFLWQLARVGDAVLQREQLQDAADAAAFESAVLYARGMNSVALLNIVLSLLLAVSTWVRAVVLLAAAGTLLSGTSDPLLMAASQPDARLDERIVHAAGLVSQLQAGVAAATPVLASVSAGLDGAETARSSPAAFGTMPLSYALLPVALDTALDVDAARPWLLRVRTAPQTSTRLGALLDREHALPSLPIEPDEGTSFCAAASWRSDQLRMRLGELAQDRALAELTRPLVDSVTSPVVQRVLRSLCEPAASCLETVSGGPKRAAALAADSCSTALEPLVASSQAGARSLAPVRVWSAAQNGNVMLQTWAIALRAAPGNKLATQRPARLQGAEPRALAQAEYYYACVETQPEWSACADNALWSLGWTARMRRLWQPVEPGSTASAAVAQAFLSSVDALRRAGSSRTSLEPERYLAQFFAAQPRSAVAFIH